MNPTSSSKDMTVEEHDVKALVLDEAKRLVTGARRAVYGTAEENLGKTAQIWSAILGIPVKAYQVSLCMIGVKMARLITTPDHWDSWCDIPGYSALGAELTIPNSVIEAIFRTQEAHEVGEKTYQVSEDDWTRILSELTSWQARLGWEENRQAASRVQELLDRLKDREPDGGVA